MERKVLDTEEIEDLKKKETIRYFMRLVEEEPEEYDEFFDGILTNDYFRIKIDLNRLLKLLKTLVADKSTDVRLLENEIFLSQNLAFVDSTKGKEVAKGSGDLYLRTYFTPKHKEETLKNEITLYTNLFKVKLNPENPTHLTFMKKMIDMRSSPILKHKKGNDSETNIKTFIELLKLTFNMKSKLKFDELAETGDTYSFGKMIKSEAPSLSRQVSGASAISTASSIRDTKSSFFENVEKLNAKRYDFYKENINYFTQILIRDTPQGLATYKDWYDEFVDGNFFEGYYVLWQPLKTYLDKYMFDSAIEDLLEIEYEEGLDGDPNVIKLYMQTVIPKKQIEDIEKGNILLLTTYFCLTLSLKDDIEFLEDLPLMYPKDLYKTKSEVTEFKFIMKQIYQKGTEITDLEIESDVEDDDDVEKELIEDRKYEEKSEKELDDFYNKFLDVVREYAELVVEEFPELAPILDKEKRKGLDKEKRKELDKELGEEMIRIFSSDNVNLKQEIKREKNILLSLSETYFIDKDLTNKEIIDIEFGNTSDGDDSDDDKSFADKLSPKSKKVIYKYFDFVRSNHDVVIEENPEFKDEKGDFIEKLIELYSVVNIQFKLLNEKYESEFVDLTDFLIDNLEFSNKDILDEFSDEYADTDSDEEESDDEKAKSWIASLSSENEKVLRKYIEFVESNYKEVLQENPKLEVDNDEFYEKLIEIYSAQNAEFKNFAESNKDDIMRLTDAILDSQEEESDDDKPFVDTLSPETKKVIYKYFDFVRSNYEVVLEENPEFKDEKGDFIEKLIELYSVVNINFSNFVESSANTDWVIGEATETLLNNLEKTNEEILEDPFS